MEVAPSSIFNGRDSFPKGFLFGTASSAYQYEGAVNEGARGISMWDHFSTKFPDRTCFSDGNEAVDFYHRYREDIKRMKEINMDAFRFSIAWPRVLPYGRRDRVSEEGIKFYNDLIDELLANGITPLATLFHWDIPQDLEMEYGGFLSEQIVDDFRDYASLCFERFGDRVKLWFTHNEPWVYSIAGYDTGKKAPGRCSRYVNGHCVVTGMSGYEAYIVSHNMLLAHAEAVEVFRKMENLKDGKIGIAHNPLWYEPYDADSPEDIEACERAQEFMFGWHQHPTAFGDYPECMKRLVGSRLPSFTIKQSEKLKKSYDFVGINYYSSVYVRNLVDVDPLKPTWRTDQHVEWMKENKDGKTLGKQAGMDWFFVYPEGLRKILKYIKDKYENPTIILAENGYGEISTQNTVLYNPSIDTERVEYHEGHLRALHRSIHEDGIQVEGYFAWSLLDNFEWNSGYGLRFGLYYIDYKDGLKRYPKMSALWFKEFLKKKEESKKSNKKERKGQQILQSITDQLSNGRLPVVIGSLFVVSATLGTSLFLKASQR